MPRRDWRAEMPLRDVTPVNATLAFVRSAALNQQRLDGRRMREDLGFAPVFPRLADAIAAGA